MKQMTASRYRVRVQTAYASDVMALREAVPPSWKVRVSNAGRGLRSRVVMRLTPPYAVQRVTTAKREVVQKRNVREMAFEMAADLRELLPRAVVSVLNGVRRVSR